jgi:hypothetical protein
MIALILLTSPFLVQLTSSAPYDAWADLDEDGDIDIFDIVNMAGRYATTGDPGRNITVTNWPLAVTSETTVWYLNSSFPLTSDYYDGSGFGYLHIFMHVLYAGPGSSIEFQVKGIFRDPDSSQTRSATAYSAIMTETPRLDVLSVTIPVPSETFYFYARVLSGDGDIFLSYYLTQA